MISILFTLFGSMYGSIQTPYLAARWKKRMDLRNYGSGMVSNSVVYEQVSR
ncbi:MAG: hypothetical protein MUO67_23775 [Anaerolineales bacterium]|nr:hypothetical protein [Anaerolineales bacterium]